MFVYWHFFKLRFFSEVVYRANMFAFVVSQAVWLGGSAFLWSAVYRNGFVLGTYSFKSIMTYSLLTAVINFWALLNIGRALSDTIQTGDLNQLLVRPRSAVGIFVAMGLGRAVIDIAFGSLLVTALFFLFADYLVAPTLLNGMMALLAFGLGMVLVVLSSLLMGALAFWFVKTGGLEIIFLFIVSFLSGDYLPIDIFPDRFRSVLEYLPFPYMMWFPLQAFLGRLTVEAYGRYFLLALLWVVLLFVSVVFVWRRGLRRYEAVSG